MHKTKEEGDEEEESGKDEAPEWSQKSKDYNEQNGLVKESGGPYELADNKAVRTPTWYSNTAKYGYHQEMEMHTTSDVADPPPSEGSSMTGIRSPIDTHSDPQRVDAPPNEGAIDVVLDPSILG